MAVKWTKLAGCGLLLEHTDEVRFAHSQTSKQEHPAHMVRGKKVK